VSRSAFGRRLAELRKASGVSQAALGEQAHVDQRRISAWEKGLNLPPPDKVPQLAKALGADPQELFELLAVASAADATQSRRELTEALQQVQRFVDTYQAFHAAYETMGRQIEEIAAEVAEIKRMVLAQNQQTPRGRARS
jgi:transcriptional regulator with XRE-family HTH domain